MFEGNVRNSKIDIFVSNNFFRRSTGDAPPIDPQFMDIHDLFYPFDQYIYYTWFGKNG
jgi:hypothetical protein